MLRLIMLVIICISYIQFSYANNDFLFRFQKRNDGQYCGRRLVNALQLICNGVYNPMFKKSSYYDGLQNNWMKEDYNDMEGTIQYPFKHRRFALSIGPETFQRRRREGIYDECCRKSCTIHELAEYCGQ